MQAPETTVKADAPTPPAPDRTTEPRHDGQVGSRGRTVLTLLLAASLILALAAQLYFANFRQYLWDGVALYALAMALFLVVVRSQESPERPAGRVLSSAWRVLLGHPWRSLALVTSVVLAAVAARSSTQQPPPPSFTPLVLLWVAAMALVLAAHLPAPSTLLHLRIAPRHWLKAHALELAALAFWLALAAVLRLWRVGEIPYPLSGDEAAMGLEARRVLAGELRNPFSTGWDSHPSLWFFALAGVMAVAGNDEQGFRTLPALIGAATVLTVYLLARRLFGVPVAQLSVGVLAAYPFHVHFSRVGLNNIVDPWLAPLVFYLVHRGIDRRDRLFMAVAGVLLGLMIYGNISARVVPIILVAYLAFMALVGTGALRSFLSGLGSLALGFLVTSLPLIAWFVANPSNFGARVAIVGVFQSGWLQREMNSTGKSVFMILWDQVQKSALAFNFYPDTSTHYFAPGPLLGFVPSVFFVFGAAYAAIGLKRPPLALLLLWIGATLAVGSVLTVGPPWAPRLVPAIPAVCILAGIGIWKVVSLFRALQQESMIAAGVLAAAIVGVVVVRDVHFYFSEYAPRAYFTEGNTEIANLLGRQIIGLGDGYQVYFVGPPRMYIDHPSLVFIVGKRVGTNVVQALVPNQRPPMVDRDDHLLFVFLPERLAELETVRAYFPGGEQRSVGGRFARALFTTYRVD